MIPGFVDELNFSEVSFEIKSKGFNFYFKTMNFTYLLVVRKRSDIYYPVTIQHIVTEKDKNVCEFCERNQTWGDCEFLIFYISEIFERLKNHPSIRLRWLKHGNI